MVYILPDDHHEIIEARSRTFQNVFEEELKSLSPEELDHLRENYILEYDQLVITREDPHFDNREYSIKFHVTESFRLVFKGKSDGLVEEAD